LRLKTRRFRTFLCLSVLLERLFPLRPPDSHVLRFPSCFLFAGLVSPPQVRSFVCPLGEDQSIPEIPRPDVGRRRTVLAFLPSSSIYELFSPIPSLFFPSSIKAVVFLPGFLILITVPVTTPPGSFLQTTAMGW